MRDTIEEVFNAAHFAKPAVIVVGTDILDAASLLPHAIAQAKAAHASLRLVHAICPSEMFAIEAGAAPYVDPARTERNSCVELESIAREAREQGVECTTVVRHGFPAEVINELVRETGAGRVIVGTHGRRGLKRFVLGSVAREILRTSPVPVCTVGPHCRPPNGQGVRMVLHPTALDLDSPRNARMALDIAKLNLAELTLLHVVGHDAGAYEHFGTERLSRQLQSLLPLSVQTPSGHIHTRLASGTVTTQILKAAEDIQADVIVLGAETSAHFWKGGSGERAYSVVGLAACPVLSLLAPEHKVHKAENVVHELHAYN